MFFEFDIHIMISYGWLVNTPVAKMDTAEVLILNRL
jgi:hypothetical protein